MHRAVKASVICCILTSSLSACSPEKECTRQQDCREGYSCVENTCRPLCLTQADCTSSTVCWQGVCTPRSNGLAPVIDSVAGNAPGDPTQISDGLLLSGERLNSIEAELRYDGQVTPLRVRQSSATSAEVVLPLEARAPSTTGLHAATYEVIATNPSGSALASATLTLPSYTGDELVSIINSTATTPLAASTLSTDMTTDSELRETIAALSARLAALEATSVIRESMTIALPSSATCADIQTAIDGLEGRLIIGSAIVTIALPNNVYECTKAITPPYPSGDRVQLIGNVDNPPSVLLKFAGSHGIAASYNRTFGLVNGLKLLGDFTASTHGVDVFGTHLDLGTGVEISNFGGHGVFVHRDGYLTANGIRSIDNGTDGINATFGSVLNASNAVASGNGRYGFYIERGTTAYADSAIATGNGQGGFVVTLQGNLVASRAQAIGNAGTGFAAMSGSYIYADGSTASGNTMYGYSSFLGSAMSCTGATASGNAPSDVSPPFNEVGAANSYNYRP